MKKKENSMLNLFGRTRRNDEKFLVIKNKGIMEDGALSLMGASTKIGEGLKIGQFGSGNKYALAYLLRNGIEPVIFAGMDRLELSTEEQKFRNESFDVIHINGKPTSITTKMGKDWELWQALREIYCNAIDEEDGTIEFSDVPEPEEGMTKFYIPITRGVEEFISNMDRYFTNKDKVVETNVVGKVLKKSSLSVNIFRRGVRCYDSIQGSMYDYDFFDIPINESRVIQSSLVLERYLWDLIFQLKDKEIIKNVLLASGDPAYIESYFPSHILVNDTVIPDDFVQVMKNFKFAPREATALLSDEELKDRILIPLKLYQAVADRLPDDCKVALMEGKDVYFSFVEPSDYQKEVLRQVLGKLRDIDLEINRPVKVGKFKGFVNTTVHRDTIVVSEDLFQRPLNEFMREVLSQEYRLKFKTEIWSGQYRVSLIEELIGKMKEKSGKIF